MVKNLTVKDKLVDVVKKHPGKVTLSFAALATAVVMLFTSLGGGKDETPNEVPQNPAYTTEMPTPEPDVIDDPTLPIHYSEWNITIDEGTKITVEPQRDGAYVGTVRRSEDAKLLMIDGDYALVLYNIPQERYDYDLSHDHIRLGYVPVDTIHSARESGILPESVLKDGRYVHFDRSTRIRNQKDDGGILTTARKGDYARVIGAVESPEWSDEEWYVVAYNGSNGTYIGYIEGKNGTFITEQEMWDIANTEYEYFTITGNDVNLRRTPEKKDGNVETRLDKGDTGLVLGTENGWRHVMCNGYEGYISTEVTCVETRIERRTPTGLETLHLTQPEQKTM